MKDLLKRNRAELTRDEDARLWNAIQKANAGHTKSLWQRFSIPAMGLAVTAAALIIVIPRLGGVDEATDSMRRQVAAVETSPLFQKAPGTEGEVSETTPSRDAGLAKVGTGSVGGDVGKARTLDSVESGQKSKRDEAFAAGRPITGDSAASGVERRKREGEDDAPIAATFDQDVSAESASHSMAEPQSAALELNARAQTDAVGNLRIHPKESAKLAPIDAEDATQLKAGVTAKNREIKIRGNRSIDATATLGTEAITPATGAPARVESARNEVEEQTWGDLGNIKSFRTPTEEERRRLLELSKRIGDERGPIPVGGSAVPNDAAFDAMYFESEGVNPFVDTEDDKLATFAIDVDTASYNMTRAYLNRGELPPTDAIRVEEFINAFDHSYGREGFASLTPSITSTGDAGAFGIYLDAAPSPFGEKLSLLRVGLKGREVAESERKPMTLTFVIDTSGSMKRGGRLELVKDALKMLLDELRPSDYVAIVTYSNQARVIAPATPLRDRWELERAIERLVPDGGTNAEAGLREAYRIAERAYDGERNNRVVLCSDGVANIGRTGADSIFEVIQREAGRGIYLTAIGVGMGNHNDALLEQLANQADGNYHYVDSHEDARRVFVDNMIGTMEAIARDVKIQVEFDPEVVSRYRLIGYENRDVADKDFRNDAVDGGEVGAGHEVTALFEVKLAKKANGKNAIATVTLRYEDLASGRMTEQEASLPLNEVRSFESTDPEFRLDAAVAEFAEILRRAYWARGGQLSDVAALVDEVGDALPGRDDVRELSRLVERAAELWPASEGGQWRQEPVPALRD